MTVDADREAPGARRAPGPSSTRLLAWAELAQRWRMIAALAVGTFLFMVAIAGSYEALGGEAELQSSFGVELPRLYSAFAGTDADVPLFAPANYLAIGFYHPLFLVLALTLAFACGSAAVAGDVESGRAEMVFPAPIRRTAVLDTRLAVWFVAQLAVVAAGWLGALAGGLLSSDMRALGVGPPTRMAVQFLGLALLVGAGAFLASCVTRTRGQAIGLALGVTLALYLLNFAGLLWEPLDPYRVVSPFAHYVPVEAVDSVDGTAFVGLAAGAVLLVAGARLAIERRDLV